MKSWAGNLISNLDVKAKPPLRRIDEVAAAWRMRAPRDQLGGNVNTVENNFMLEIVARRRLDCVERAPDHLESEIRRGLTGLVLLLIRKEPFL